MGWNFNYRKIRKRERDLRYVIMLLFHFGWGHCHYKILSVLNPLISQDFPTEFFQEMYLCIRRSHTLSCTAWGFSCAAELVSMRHIVQSKLGYDLYRQFLMCTQRFSGGVTFSPSKKTVIVHQMAAQRHLLSLS